MMTRTCATSLPLFLCWVLPRPSRMATLGLSPGKEECFATWPRDGAREIDLGGETMFRDGKIRSLGALGLVLALLLPARSGFRYQAQSWSRSTLMLAARA